MAGEQLPGSPAFSPIASSSSSFRNPFRSSGSTLFSYSLHGEAKTISSGPYRLYQAIFDRECSEPYYIPDDASVKVAKLSGLSDIELGDLWDDALRATYLPSSPAVSREGYLTRDEFFILLASLQEKLQIDDDLFQHTFAPYQDSDSVQASPSTTYSSVISPSTTYSSMSGLDEQREGTRTPGSQRSKSAISRKPIARGQLMKSRSISESIQGPATETEEVYADGFAEFHSSLFQNRFPSFKQELENTGSAKQPQLDDAASWVCSKCASGNSIDSLTCSVCQFRRNDPYSDKIVADSTQVESPITPMTPETSIRRPDQELVDGMDSKKAVLFSLPSLPEVVAPSLPEVVLPDAPEVVLPDAPEVVPEIESGLELVDTAREGTRPTRNPRLTPGFHEMDSQVATQDSDAQALALITAIEPRPEKKLQPKRSTSKFKQFSRTFRSGSKSSKKLEKPEETPLDPDTAVSGFTLGGLAKILGDAAEAGDLPLIASLIKLGADVNFSSRKKEVYHYAASRAITSGNDHVVEYMLSKGMNEKSATHALHQAILRGNCLNVATKLVPHADFNFMWEVKGKGDGEKKKESCLGALSRMKDEYKRDRSLLLSLIMEQPRFDAEKPAVLLELPSEHVALSVLSCLAHQAGLVAVESFLLQLGDNYKIPRQQRYGSPYIHVDPLACISVDYWQRESKLALEMAQLLLKHGSRVTGVKEKYTPLVSALAAGCISGVRLLLDLGADPECVMTTVGWSSTLSPLSFATQELSVSIDICRALIDRGAKPWRADEQGRTPLYWACRKGNFEAIKYLFKLDTVRSNINNFNKCLEAAIDSYNPEVARELVNLGACATGATWNYAMSAKPVGSLRNSYLEIIEILLTTKTSLSRELVLDAIDHQNFWGLNRILEIRNGILDFDKDAMFSDPRWTGIVCKASRNFGPRAKKYGWGTRRDKQTCLTYAEEKNAHEITALLKSHDWENWAECEADCSLKLWEDACSSTPPHRLHNGYSMEIAGARKGSV